MFKEIIESKKLKFNYLKVLLAELLAKPRDATNTYAYTIVWYEQQIESINAEICYLEQFQ